MKTKFSTLLATAALLLATTGLRAAEPDTSTPLKAGVAFAKALQEGNIDQAKTLADGNELQWKVMKTISDFSVAMQALETALVGKFGEAGKLPPEMKMNLADEFGSMEEKIDGDKATLINKKKPDDKFPPTLKKVGDSWKMDLSNVSADPDMAQAMAVLTPMAEKAKAISADVTAGKYTSKDEALAALIK